ncbi:MAG: Obg family GTPase CgtA [Candidatus Omnitrophica bacterium]|nr:Obg family GTPase CgtA [Candidatus Omnitrophota bacterium]
MQFVDRVEITVTAGAGGRGCQAFAQPPYIRYPYPDGGNGGDVQLQADPNVATLLDFQFRHEFAAGRGGHGGGNGKTGRRGEEVVIRVPVGTVIHDAVTGQILRDLAHPRERILIVRGGRGGLGNATVAARQRQLTRPRGGRSGGKAGEAHATPGEPGEGRRLLLELKLIADVGVIGCPNAGKSSLLSRLSTARPKVGAYPFTTRYPVLGVVQVPRRGSFVACDIPGLIEGAHQGKGLGVEFLRHVERTRVLVHLIDMAGVDGRDPLADYRQVNGELAAYHEALVEKPQVVVANKMDLPQAAANVKRMKGAVGGQIWPISCATGQGIPRMLEAVWKELHP